MAGDRMTAAEFRAMQAPPPAPASNPRSLAKQQFALGHRAPGEMNKTEARYRDEVIIPAMVAGELLWWAFEGIKLRLAPNTFLTVDFAQMRDDGTLELVDVKGCKAMIEEDALAKVKVAADKYPFRFFWAWPNSGTRKLKTGWHIEGVGR